MKKLLSMIGAMTLIGAASTNVIACDKGEKPSPKPSPDQIKELIDNNVRIVKIENIIKWDERLLANMNEELKQIIIENQRKEDEGLKQSKINKNIQKLSKQELLELTPKKLILSGGMMYLSIHKIKSEYLKKWNIYEKNINPHTLISNKTINHNSNSLLKNSSIESANNQNFDSSIRNTINHQAQESTINIQKQIFINKNIKVKKNEATDQIKECNYKEIEEMLKKCPAIPDSKLNNYQHKHKIKPLNEF